MTAEEVLKQIKGDLAFINDDEILEAMKYYARFYANQMPVFRICSHCNKEFELQVANAISERVSAFQNCDHCGKRNDTWISIRK